MQDDAKSYVTKRKIKHSDAYRSRKFWERIVEEKEAPELQNLELPPHFNEIYNMFVILDSHLSMAKQRKQGAPGSVTLSMLTEMFEKGSAKAFSKRHLARILAVNSTLPLFAV